MKITNFKKGLLSASLGSFWWGVLGVFYFKYFSFVGHLELVIHRCLWTSLVLILTTIYFSKWDLFLKTVKNSKNIFILFFTGILTPFENVNVSVGLSPISNGVLGLKSIK